jgi:hypothetical protein
VVLPLFIAFLLSLFAFGGALPIKYQDDAWTGRPSTLKVMEYIHQSDPIQWTATIDANGVETQMTTLNLSTYYAAESELWAASPARLNPINDNATLSQSQVLSRQPAIYCFKTGSWAFRTTIGKHNAEVAHWFNYVGREVWSVTILKRKDYNVKKEAMWIWYKMEVYRVDLQLSSKSYSIFDTIPFAPGCQGKNHDTRGGEEVFWYGDSAYKTHLFMVDVQTDKCNC